MRLIFLMSILLFNLISGVEAQPIERKELVNENTNPTEQVVPKEAHKLGQTVSVIIEVDGNPNTYKRDIEQRFPSVEVVQTYSILFQGIALKGPPKKIDDVLKRSFAKAVYPVQTYTTPSFQSTILNELYMPKNKRTNLFSQKHLNQMKEDNIVFPNEVNKTNYTGKGINIAIIDTGIDYTHPDLQQNFIKGKDLVDLDDDPMETTIDEGPPTNHGTHVAGIIGANGNLHGVAPEANILAYRALGPGGVGTTVQVLAALEEAVIDNVDIINLSLGNSVNGPDYPTSVAVNAAAKHGVAVVIANGNEGPNNWTVGSPATASKALSVGAYAKPVDKPALYDAVKDKTIELTELPFSPRWDLQRDRQVVTNLKDAQINDRIALLELDENSYETILQAEQLGAKAVLIYETELVKVEQLLQTIEQYINIPVALISVEDGVWLQKRAQDNVYFKQKLINEAESVAPFSSRGPVTVNWMLKPDIIAPGVNILSTVPNGYEILNGTSMATPHITGIIALIKEAHPTWTNEQIFGALKTTAKQIKEDKTVISPWIQGTGLAQVAEAIQTDTIIYNPLLSFGKVNDHITERTINVTIENKSAIKHNYSFQLPKKKKGISWNLQKKFTIRPKEKRTIPVTIKTNSMQLDEGIHEGDLLLVRHDNQKYNLPYMFINETAGYPHIMGFAFHLNTVDDTHYEYELHIAEKVQSVQVHLYDPHTLLYEDELIYLTDLKVGINEGEVKRKDIRQKGHFYGLIVAKLENGQYVNYETDVYLD